jgi:hypothetical protein
MGIIRATTPQVRGRRRTQTRHPTNSISSVVWYFSNGVNDKERLGLSKRLSSARPCSSSSKSKICKSILGIWHEPAQATFCQPLGRVSRTVRKLYPWDQRTWLCQKWGSPERALHSSEIGDFTLRKTVSWRRVAVGSRPDRSEWVPVVFNLVKPALAPADRSSLRPPDGQACECCR